MNKTQFKAFALRSGGYAGGLTVDHVCLVADGHNWNCFGGGVGDPRQANLIAEGMGNAVWASKIYGDYEGRGGDCPAAEVIEKYEGVCHTAANRLLVLIGDNFDSRKAVGNELATLLYGKFGFNLDKYIKRVRQAAEEVNAVQPGSVSPEEVEAVICRVTRGLAPDQELELLKADMEEHFQVHFDDFTSVQKEEFIGTYTNFQKRRQEKFEAEPEGNPQDFQARFAARLRPDLLECLNSFKKLMGPEQYTKIFAAAPDEAAHFLLGPV